LGGLSILIVITLLIGLCICVKYLRWKRNENLKILNDNLKREKKEEKQKRRRLERELQQQRPGDDEDFTGIEI